MKKGIGLVLAGLVALLLMLAAVDGVGAAKNVGAVFAVAGLGLGCAVLCIKALDALLFPEVRFGLELEGNNLAVGVFLGAVALGVLLLFGGIARAAPPDRYDDGFRFWARYHFGYAIDWQYFKAQGMTESRLEPTVCSGVGACGLMQFMPGTAMAMGLQDRFDARASIREGIRYDRRLWRQWTAPRPAWDRLMFAFASYNAGLGSVLAFQREAARAGSDDSNLWPVVAARAWREPRQYVERINRWCERFTAWRACRPAPGG